MTMPRPEQPLATQLERDLAELKLLEIARCYRDVLDEAARKGSSLLEVLGTLIGMEQAVRQQRALERRLRQARLPKQKTLADYDFAFPKRVPKTALVRLFDCDFIPRYGCAVLIGPTGTGKTHLLTALGYTACERGYSVSYTRVVDMLNHLATAQINGRLAKALKTYVRPQLLLLDELGYLPISFARASGPSWQGSRPSKAHPSAMVPSPHARLPGLEQHAGSSALRRVRPLLAARPHSAL
jgi:DNA replication protein DnaC